MSFIFNLLCHLSFCESVEFLMESAGGTFKLFHTDKVSQNKQLEQNCYHIVSVLVHYLVFCPIGDKQEILEE